MAAYQLGESYAASVGVPVRAFSVVLVLLSSLLAACVTAFAGPISFVGIAVPHLVNIRWAVQTAAGAAGLRTGRRGILPAVRPDRPQPVCTHRAVHQLGHSGVRCAGGHLAACAPPQQGGHGMSCCETQISPSATVRRCCGTLPCTPSAAKFWRSSVRTARANPLFKTLAGQLAAQGGAVLLDGQDLTAYTPNARARKLALMLPHTARTELTSCFEVAAAGRYPYTGRLGILSDADRQQVHDALCLVRAEELEDRDFARISDGQRQRVLLARAVCQQPEILLLDEPTSFWT